MPGDQPLEAYEKRLMDAWTGLGLAPEDLDLQTAAPSDNVDAPVWTDDYSDLVSVVIF